MDAMTAVRQPHELRRVLQLAPLGAAVLFAVLGAPQLGMLFIPMSWLGVGIDRQRPRWLTHAVGAGTILWVFVAFVLAAPVGGGSGPAS